MKKRMKILHDWFLSEKGSLKKIIETTRKDPVLKYNAEKISEFERAMSGYTENDPPVSHFDMERLEEVLFAKSVQKIVNLKALTSVAALLLLIFTAVIVINQKPEFLSRGKENLKLPRLYVFCYDGNELKRLDKTHEKEIPECKISSELQFAINNPIESEYSCIHISGTDQKGNRLWYYPEYGSEKSLKIEKGVENKAFKESIVLNANHKPGKLTISVKFSKPDSNGNCPELKNGKCIGFECYEQKTVFEITE